MPPTSSKVNEAPNVGGWAGETLAAAARDGWIGEFGGRAGGRNGRRQWWSTREAAAAAAADDEDHVESKSRKVDDEEAA